MKLHQKQFDNIIEANNSFKTNFCQLNIYIHNVKFLIFAKNNYIEINKFLNIIIGCMDF